MRCHLQNPTLVRSSGEKMKIYNCLERTKKKNVIGFCLLKGKKNPKVFHHNLSIFSFFFFFWKNEEYALRKKRRQLKKRVFLEEV